jgi:hypothetical protein
MVKVISQNPQRVVLEGTVDGFPELTERWTIAVDAIGADPGLLEQVRNELDYRLEQKRLAWIATQAAIANL